VFTFTNPFANTPVVLCQIGAAGGTTFLARVTASAATGFTVTVNNSASGAATDEPFAFLAEAVS
jgi:hypothetical protein